jgi:transposase
MTERQRPAGGSLPLRARPRGAVHAVRHLAGFSGALQVEGYIAYDALTEPSRAGGPLTLAFCWARRALDPADRASVPSPDLKLWSPISRATRIASRSHQADWSRPARQASGSKNISPLLPPLVVRVQADYPGRPNDLKS